MGKNIVIQVNFYLYYYMLIVPFDVILSLVKTFITDTTGKVQVQAMMTNKIELK